MPNHVTNTVSVTGPEAALKKFAEQHIVRDKEREERDVTATEASALECAGLDLDLKTRGNFFDFGTVVPKPACIDGTESGSEADVGYYALTGLDTRSEFAISLGQGESLYESRTRNYKAYTGTSLEDFREHLRLNHPHVLEKGAKCVQAKAETGHMDWHSWCCAMWGTKWNSYSYQLLSTSKSRLRFKFDTAWSPPEPVFRKVSEMHPELSFEIKAKDEGGPQYTGHFKAGVGEIFEVSRKKRA